MVLQLFRDGWQLAHAPLPYVGDGERFFDRRMVRHSALYFRALLESGPIFDRGATKIVHMMLAKYYELLLSTKDARRLHDRVDFWHLRDADFAKMLKGEAVPLRGDVPVLMDVGAELAVDLEHELEIVMEEAGDLDAGHVDAAAAGGHGHPPEELLVVDDRPPRYSLDGFTVLWDFHSHSSGHRRGYVKCHRHPECYRYSQMRLYASPCHCAAYLLAWAILGDIVDPVSHVSPLFQPPEDLVAECRARLG